MKDFVEIVLVPKDAESLTLLVAYLTEMPIDSLWEDGDLLRIYIQKDLWTQELSTQLQTLTEQFVQTSSVSEMPRVNWNEKWEAQFTPVEVGSFCRVRASFHAPRGGFQYEIVIDPKMAFGTGHHETTYMMMDAMKDFSWSGHTVLDYGSGTGILSILAKKMRAQSVTGVEIEEIAVENAIENAQINGCDIDFLCGDITLADGLYDIILANINRNVLTATMQDMKDRLKAGGLLFISGFLQADEQILLTALNQAHLKPLMTRKRGEWLCMVAQG